MRTRARTSGRGFSAERRRRRRRAGGAAQLDAAGEGGGKTGRGGPRRGHLRAGGDPVRTADGPAAVPGGDGGGNDPASDLPGPGASVAAERQGAPRPGNHLPEV